MTVLPSTFAFFGLRMAETGVGAKGSLAFDVTFAFTAFRAASLSPSVRCFMRCLPSAVRATRPLFCAAIAAEHLWPVLPTMVAATIRAARTVARADSKAPPMKHANPRRTIWFSRGRCTEFQRLSNAFGPVHWIFQQSFFKDGNVVKAFLIAQCAK